MARPRAFDETTAIDAATACFRARGYEATSVRDLADGMGIGAASLYNAFGDKRALYRRALDRYLDLSIRERIARLESAMPAREAIAAYFDEVIARSLQDREHRGCLLVDSAFEVAPHDAVLRAHVARELKSIEAFFRRCVDAARPTGRHERDAPSSDDVARLLLGVLIGIRVLARTRPQRALLEGMVRPALAMLDAPVPRRRAASKR